MAEFVDLVARLITTLWELLVLVGGWVFSVALAIAWFAWWLWGVNWGRLWPVLQRGAWVVVVLLVLMAALVWSQIAPTGDESNFWRQLGWASLVTALTLFCGWLQGVFGWAPPEIELEPVEAAGGHDDGHGHH